MKRLYFEKKWPGRPYNAGDVAVFDDDEAVWPVEKKIAREISESEWAEGRGEAEVAAGARGGRVETQARRGGPRA